VDNLAAADGGSVMSLGKKVRNRVKILRGTMQKNFGKATGNKRLEAKGRAAEAFGKIKKYVLPTVR
jgi:uncharacterized protein YjbJ (UPF0337 family)